MKNKLLLLQSVTAAATYWSASSYLTASAFRNENTAMCVIRWSFRGGLSFYDNFLYVYYVHETHKS